MARRIFIIDGNKFNDIESFYNEIDKLLTKDLNWKTGHNLDAFNDLLRGGFGVHEYGEPIHFKWINFQRSQEILGNEATIIYLESILSTYHYSNKEFIHSKINNLRTGTGKTFLDEIIEIILLPSDSGHDCTLTIYDDEFKE